MHDGLCSRTHFDRRLCDTQYIRRQFTQLGSPVKLSSTTATEPPTGLRSPPRRERVSPLVSPLAQRSLSAAAASGTRRACLAVAGRTDGGSGEGLPFLPVGCPRCYHEIRLLCLSISLLLLLMYLRYKCKLNHYFGP